MTQHKAKPMLLSARCRAGAVIGAAMLLLASLAACSPAQTSAPGEQAATQTDALITAHPFGDQTPAQRRAAWLKREWTRQPTQSLAQNAGINEQTASD